MSTKKSKATTSKNKKVESKKRGKEEGEEEEVVVVVKKGKGTTKKGKETKPKVVATKGKKNKKEEEEKEEKEGKEEVSVVKKGRTTTTTTTDTKKEEHTSKDEGGGTISTKKGDEEEYPTSSISIAKSKSVVSSRGSAPKGAIEVVLSFDTTGSMYACLGVVRQSLSQLATDLFKQFPAIRIGVIAHGDYCDEGSSYVKKVLPFSNDVKQIVDWISNVGASGGGDFPEAYELSLRTARTEFSWSAGSRKSLVLVGDAPPHEANYPGNKDKIDWQTEAKLLGEDGVVIYAIQALNYSQSNHFYSTIASLTGGIRLSLDQFAESPDFVRAICYREVGPEHLQAFEDSVRARGNVSRAMNRMFDALAGRTPVKGADRGDLKAVEPGRFQILSVPRDVDIKGFVSDNGLLFSKGAGYYQFTKPELIQKYKLIVLRDKATGDLFSGEVARDMLGLPKGGDSKIKPTALDEYDVFVQSTSVNRKLIGGTLFLYEVTREDV